MGRNPGDFEQLVLFALVALGDDAYGASVRREIEARTERSVSAGSVYTVLERLESRGLVASRVGEPSPERGGRRKKHYTLTREGAVLLRQVRDEARRMAAGLDARLDRLAEGTEG